MAQTLKVRKGDTVQVIKGKDRGKQGRVIEADPKHNRILVENVNTIIRHQRPRPIQNSSRMGGPSIIPGGVIDKAAPIAASKVMVVCPVCNRPTRVGITEKEIRGERVRIRTCRRADCAKEIDK